MACECPLASVSFGGGQQPGRQRRLPLSTANSIQLA